MALLSELRKILEGSNLSFVEVRAFEAGLAHLSYEEQQAFFEGVSAYPELIYPIYINYKAKLHAMVDSDEAWEAAVEKEIEELNDLIERRRVGDELF